MLKFKKWGEYALISECRQYSIAKSGPADDYLYQVFRLTGYNKRSDTHRSHNLLTFRSSVEAKMYIIELEKINAEANQT